ncbi:unnamed protein product [marine sediment metagenome]|uniref:Uncharacterized protein n=1 Tax=marine sediment metagenome TaxID=412755 RepID=X1MV28_9ZZZZ
MPSKTTVAIIAIALLLGIALFKGINGAALASGLVVIAGLGGYVVGKVKKS